MVIVSAVSGLLFLGVCAVLGVRLLLLARKTRQQPELLFGAGLTFMVILGCPPAIAGTIPGLLSPRLASAASASSLLFVEAGVLCIFAFTWRVFRPSARWAALLVAAVGVMLFVQVVGTAYAGLPARSPAEFFEFTRPWTMAHHVLMAGAFGWSAIESLMYHQTLTRRLALGLAEPVVVDRFALWGRMGISSTLLNGANTVCLLVGLNIMTHPIPQLSTAVFGMSAATFLYLGFLPPDWYLTRVRNRPSPSTA
jgi:hypothetical protein